MIDYLGYNLTNYKSFRDLQLQYIKIRDENDSLKGQLQSLSDAYGQKCREVIELKTEELEQKLKLKNKNLKYKKLYRQLFESIEANLSCVTKNNAHRNSPSNKSNFSASKCNDNSIFMHVQQGQNLQKICKKLSLMTKDHLQLQEKSIKLQQKLQLLKQKNNNVLAQNQEMQHKVIKQVEKLERQLQFVQKQKIELEAKNNILERNSKKLEIQMRQLKRNCAELEQKVHELVKQTQQKRQEDTEFALDFMTFQLQTIQSLFTRVAQSTTSSPQISRQILNFFTDYEELSEIFRQKLQIEYDLEQLQQTYKRQKTFSTVQENLIIETRRQIQTFRLQLLKQKEIFRQKQQHIEQNLQHYLNINQEEMKIRNYSYEVENRFYRQKRSETQTCAKTTTRQPTVRDIITKKTQVKKILDNPLVDTQLDYERIQNKEDLDPVYEKKTSLKFKQTNNVEELMQEIIKNDKKNLQKILKQTKRSSSIFYKEMS